MRWLLLGVSALMFSAAALGLPGFAKEAEANPAAVSVGEQYLGTPYGAYGLDCSGFTQEVYGQLGVYLPDSPAAQWYYGYQVGYPSPGDLVFFDSYSDGGIDHVGIYAGNGMVLHSSTYYGSVVESPMYYIPGYVGAVRL